MTPDLCLLAELPTETATALLEPPHPSVHQITANDHDPDLILQAVTWTAVWHGLRLRLVAVGSFGAHVLACGKVAEAARLCDQQVSVASVDVSGTVFEFTPEVPS